MPVPGRLRGVAGEPRIGERAAGLLQLRQPEVEQLHAGLGQHDVAGLEIAMDDAVAMRGVERRRDFDRVFDRLIRWQRAFRQSIGQRLTLEARHDEEVRALVLADVVERADVGMIERARSPWLRVRSARDGRGRPRIRPKES